MALACSDVLKKRWKVEIDCLRRTDGLQIPLVHKLPAGGWVDDMKSWPQVSYKNIFNYLVLSEGVDGDAMENYKSMQSFQLFQGLKVESVLMFQVTPGLCYLKAAVTPSQSVNNAKHQAWVLVQSTGIIEAAGCSCIAGRGTSCSHAGAILWKLEYATQTGRSGMACTDQQQVWNRGTAKNLEPRRIQEITFKRKRASDELETSGPSSQLSGHFHAYSTQMDLVKAAETSALSKLYKFGQVSRAVSAKTTPPSMTSHATEHTAHETNSLSCTQCKTFFDSFVKTSKRGADELNLKTLTQSASEIWKCARRVRITASTAKKVPKRAQTSAEKFLKAHIYPTFKGNANTEHGHTYEKVAFEELKDLGFDILPSGIKVCDENAWLCASPDGVDDTNVFEVKCPVMKPGEVFQDRLKTGNLCDVHMVNGKPQLRENGPRGYYTQVQLTMLCTGKQNCKFFVWSQAEQLLLDIPFHADFVRKEVARLKTFYFVHMLPRLADEFITNRLELNAEYRQLVSLS